MHISAEQRRQSFSVWLRTGRWPGYSDKRGREFKFNPWHDPRNGRFTFAGAGRYFGQGGGTSANNQVQDVPHVEFVDDPAKPPIASMEEADAWAAEQLAEHGEEPGYPEAIEARLQLYRDALAPPSHDPLSQVVDFAAGAAEAVYDIAEGTVTSLYSLFTTNPATTVGNIGLGIAGAIDTAIAAEDTPAYVHFDRARNSVANASAHDLGYGFGTLVGNVGLAIAPGAVASKISAVRRAGVVRTVSAPKAPPGIIWVDENAGLKGIAKEYNDSATGARSSALTKRGQAPALPRTMPDGTTRLVKFDGVDGRTIIDRKWSILTTQKAKNQALRQSDVLAQHGLTGRWEVPTQAQQARALKMLKELNVSNIEVRVVKSW